MTSWLNTAKNVVAGAVQKKPESPAPDEGFDRSLRIFLSLGDGINKLQSSARESLLAFQKMCGSNRDLAAVFAQQSSASKAVGVDIRAWTDQFSFVNATLTTTYLNELVNQLHSTVLKPLAKDKERDAETKSILEERKRLMGDVEAAKRGGDSERAQQRLQEAHSRARAASDRAIDHLGARNKERARLVLRSLSALFEAQRAFFGATFTLYTDVLDLAADGNDSSAATPSAAPQAARRVEEASFVSFEDEQPAARTPTPSPTSATTAAPSAAAATAAFVSFEDEPASSVGASVLDANPPPSAHPQPSVAASLADVLEDSPLADFVSRPAAPTPPPAAAPASAASELLLFESEPKTKPAAVDPFRVFDNLPRNEREVTEESRHKLKPLPADPEVVRERQEAVLSRLADREAIELSEKEERAKYDEEITSSVEAWSAGKSGNLRALLASLHSVLWEDCGWKETALSDLIQPNKVKLAYRKALMVLHPDKMSDQPLERRLLAERVFSVLHDTYEPLKGELG